MVLPRSVVIISLLIIVFGSLLLGILSVSQTQMSQPDRCTVSQTAANCGAMPGHAFHVLADNLRTLQVVGAIVPFAYATLLIVLTAVSFLTLVRALEANKQVQRVWRKFLRFHQLLSLVNLQKFRAWRVILEEVHPSYL
jgi:hypothetical protein